ncbi:hypothetical protein TorRG33x02_070950 [Trema orientale]|uniref:Uncharacterized protein n=1 Tax=Trema orientale TaxID=63057 RepID=A0A2P5FGW8_TREOI|nr:hypothetical protein TorRG33x02_070950 [Trema orientale]
MAGFELWFLVSFSCRRKWKKKKKKKKSAKARERQRERSGWLRIDEVESGGAWDPPVRGGVGPEFGSN